MKVRRATMRDLSAVARIARVSWRTTYRPLLDITTIERWLEAAYSPTALRRRLQDHPMFVVDADGYPIAFCDVLTEGGHEVIAALCTHPEYRRQGAATLLVASAQALSPRLPISVDLVLGNRTAEAFVERMGFVPGETMEQHLYGEAFVERRWWLLSASLRAPCRS